MQGIIRRVVRVLVSGYIIKIIRDMFSGKSNDNKDENK